jgi:hypothetical protein
VVVIGVSDDGPGLPPDLAAAPFEPKRRGHSASAGAGLGLSIAQGIVVAHGGQIRPRRPARGTSFEIRLPVEAPGGASGAPPADGATHDRAAAGRPASDRATPVADAAPADPAGAVLAANGTASGTADIKGAGETVGTAGLAAAEAAIETDAAVKKRAGNGRSGRLVGQARGTGPVGPARAPRPGAAGNGSSPGRGHGA